MSTDEHQGDERNFDLEKFIRTGMSELTRSERRIGILLAGKPGIGKSTLINAIFGRKLATTGVGASVTKFIEPHRIPGSPITIYDAPGVEVGQPLDEYVNKLVTEVRLRYPDPNERIHFGLYCVEGRSTRFEEPEEAIVRAISEELLVALVMTRCMSEHDKQALELRDSINERGLKLLSGQPFLTLAMPLDIGLDKPLPAFGLESLLHELANNVDEGERHTLVRYQNVSLDLKIAESKEIVRLAVIQAGVIAATPLPILDAIPISILQLHMLGRISAQVGLSVDAKAVATGIGAIVGVATVARFAAGFFKLIPGVGSAINAGIAASATKLMGEAYLEACAAVMKRQINGELVIDSDVTDEIIGEFRQRFNPSK
jgi:uncharacterized protein (DUF697 family)/GTP-binding protein EngB required for normal cell division